MDRTIQEIYLDASTGKGEALAELIVRLQPLVISSIKRYYNKKDEMDDLVQEGRLEIILAMEDYRNDYSVPFLGYIKSRLKYLYLGKNRIRKELSLNVTIGEDGEEHIELLQDEFNMEGHYLKMEEKEAILLMVRGLPGRERQVVEGYYFLNLSIGEIAKKYGITYRTVINTKKRALSKMKKRMEEKNV